MKWSEVRQLFPERCVLIEALKSETRGKERIIEEMSVIDDFENGNAAWREYKKLHAEIKAVKLYIFHTNKEETKVIEVPYVGVEGEKTRLR